MFVKLHHIQNTEAYIQFMLCNCDQYLGAFRYITEYDVEFQSYFYQYVTDVGIQQYDDICVLYEDYLFYLPKQNIFVTPNYIVTDKNSNFYYTALIKFVRNDMIPSYLVQQMIDNKIISQSFEIDEEDCYYEFNN